MTSAQMTLISAVGAAIGFWATNLPDGTPKLYELLLGGLNAGIMVFLGVTNKGTTVARPKRLKTIPRVKPPMPPGVP